MTDIRSALEQLLPYAVSRVEDMHESAEQRHGEGKAYRCACYRRANARVAQAHEALGMMPEFTAAMNWGAQMARAAITDSGPNVGGCSWDGVECGTPASDMASLLAIPGAVEALAKAGAS